MKPLLKSKGILHLTRLVDAQQRDDGNGRRALSSNRGCNGFDRAKTLRGASNTKLQQEKQSEKTANKNNSGLNCKKSKTALKHKKLITETPAQGDADSKHHLSKSETDGTGENFSHSSDFIKPVNASVLSKINETKQAVNTGKSKYDQESELLLNLNSCSTNNVLHPEVAWQDKNCSINHHFVKSNAAINTPQTISTSSECASSARNNLVPTVSLSAIQDYALHHSLRAPIINRTLECQLMKGKETSIDIEDETYGMSPLLRCDEPNVVTSRPIHTSWLQDGNMLNNFGIHEMKMSTLMNSFHKVKSSSSDFRRSHIPVCKSITRDLTCFSQKPIANKVTSSISDSAAALHEIDNKNSVVQEQYVKTINYNYFEKDLSTHRGNKDLAGKSLQYINSHELEFTSPEKQIIIENTCRGIVSSEQNINNSSLAVRMPKVSVKLVGKKESCNLDGQPSAQSQLISQEISQIPIDSDANETVNWVLTTKTDSIGNKAKTYSVPAAKTHSIQNRPNRQTERMTEKSKKIVPKDVVSVQANKYFTKQVHTKEAMLLSVSKRQEFSTKFNMIEQLKSPRSTCAGDKTFQYDTLTLNRQLSSDSLHISAPNTSDDSPRFKTNTSLKRFRTVLLYPECLPYASNSCKPLGLRSKSNSPWPGTQENSSDISKMSKTGGSPSFPGDKSNRTISPHNTVANGFDLRRKKGSSNLNESKHFDGANCHIPIKTAKKKNIKHSILPAANKKSKVKGVPSIDRVIDVESLHDKDNYNTDKHHNETENFLNFEPETVITNSGDPALCQNNVVKENTDLRENHSEYLGKLLARKKHNAVTRDKSNKDLGLINASARTTKGGGSRKNCAETFVLSKHTEKIMLQRKESVSRDKLNICDKNCKMQSKKQQINNAEFFELTNNITVLPLTSHCGKNVDNLQNERIDSTVQLLNSESTNEKTIGLQHVDFSGSKRGNGLSELTPTISNSYAHTPQATASLDVIDEIISTTDLQHEKQIFSNYSDKPACIQSKLQINEGNQEDSFAEAAINNNKQNGFLINNGKRNQLQKNLKSSYSQITAQLTENKRSELIPRPSNGKRSKTVIRKNILPGQKLSSKVQEQPSSFSGKIQLNKPMSTNNVANYDSKTSSKIGLYRKQANESTRRNSLARNESNDGTSYKKKPSKETVKSIQIIKNAQQLAINKTNHKKQSKDAQSTENDNLRPSEAVYSLDCLENYVSTSTNHHMQDNAHETSKSDQNKLNVYDNESNTMTISDLPSKFTFPRPIDFISLEDSVGLCNKEANKENKKEFSLEFHEESASSESEMRVFEADNEDSSITVNDLISKFVPVNNIELTEEMVTLNNEESCGGNGTKLSLDIPSDLINTEQEIKYFTADDSCIDHFTNICKFYVRMRSCSKQTDCRAK